MILVPIGCRYKTSHAVFYKLFLQIQRTHCGPKKDLLAAVSARTSWILVTRRDTMLPEVCACYVSGSEPVNNTQKGLGLFIAEHSQTEK